jgi:phosphate transport system permease protein
MRYLPSLPGGKWAEGAYRWAAIACAVSVLAFAAALFFELVRNSMPSITRFGIGFITSQQWNPVSEEFGAASSIFGTLVSTGIALVIAIPLSLVTALFLVELAPPTLSRVAGGAVELLAAIPSIIYGMWGLFVFAPFMADHVQPYLMDAYPDFPLFAGAPMGIGMLTAGIILALMVLPFITSVTRDVFRLVPPVLKESAYGLGSTTWEVTHKVTVRYGIRGVVGACFLGLGRAIGETMAVTFVIGNEHRISASLFDAGNSIASTLANEFSEASEPMYLSSLVELGLVLLVITVVIQSAAHLWLMRMQRSSGSRS